MDVREITKVVRNMNLYKNSVNKKSMELNETEYEMLRLLLSVKVDHLLRFQIILTLIRA